MIFQELIQKHSLDEVWPRFLEFYPNQEDSFDGYDYVYNIEYKKEPIFEDKILINIEFFPKDEENDVCWDVSGVKEESNQEWAIELESFRNWLGYEIPQKLLDSMSEIDIICHCLYETTFFGYSEKEKQIIREQLDKALEEIEKGLISTKEFPGEINASED